jgi:hypothetical protein
MRCRRVFLFAALTGCASQPQPVADTTPQSPTAVFETQFTMTGIGGGFPLESTEKHYVRRDMRRDEQGATTIDRLDRQLRWTLDRDNRQYTECPVYGCVIASTAHKLVASEARGELKQKTEQGCVTRIASSQYDVQPTGQKRILNGFDTAEYRMVWVVRLQDRQERTTTSTVNVELWTAPATAEMREALDTEAAFLQAFLLSGPRALAPKNAKAQVLPAELVRMMTTYFSSLRGRDRPVLRQAARLLNKMTGHPIQAKAEWFVEGDACGAKEEERPAAQPIATFAVEVKQLGVAPVHDSAFVVPAGYELVRSE